MGRGRRVVLRGGLQDAGWICASIVGRRWNTEIFTGRNDSSITTVDQTTTSRVASRRNGRKPPLGFGRNYELNKSIVVSGWKARAAGSLEGGRVPATL